MKPTMQKTPHLSPEIKNTLTPESSGYVISQLKEREKAILKENKMRLADINYAGSQLRRNLAEELGIIRQDIETLNNLKEKTHIYINDNKKVTMEGIGIASEPLGKVLTQFYMLNQTEEKEMKPFREITFNIHKLASTNNTIEGKCQEVLAHIQLVNNATTGEFLNKSNHLLNEIHLLSINKIHKGQLKQL